MQAGMGIYVVTKALLGTLTPNALSETRHC